MIWKPISEARKDGSIFWGWLSDTGIKRVRWVSSAETMEELGGVESDYVGVWADARDSSDQWWPQWWCELDDIPEPLAK